MTSAIPSFHDGNLIGVEVADGQAILKVKRVNGELYELLLSSVSALHINEFREGNIIYAVEVIRGVTPPPELLDRLFPAPHPTAAVQYHDAHAKLLASKVSKITANEAAVVVVTPSYGADLAAFCVSVTLRTVTISVS